MHGPLGQYDNLGKIGEGTYGVVLKCRHKVTGALVAIKKFKECEDDEQVRKTAMREVKVLQGLRHDNIVRLLDVFRFHRKLFLVFEYVEGTVLQELERSPQGLGDTATRQIMWQLVRATEHLHSSKIVHRDIKPENMLLSSAGLLKLCDFGFARYLSAPHVIGDMSDYVATRWYRAPELLVGDRSYGPSVDIWAIGCMVMEMQTGQPLFPGTSDIDQLWLILKACNEEQLADLRGNPLFQDMQIPQPHERETLEQRFPFLDSDILNFLKACLQPNPAKRKRCWELLQMPYFFGVESWFPRGFFPSLAEKGMVRQAMSVERQRVKPRRPKRKADARANVLTQALNISPCRDQRVQELKNGYGSFHASPSFSPMEADSCSISLPSEALCSTSMTVAQAGCSISVPKGSKQKGNVYTVEVRAGPIPSDTAAHLDTDMGEGPSVSGQEPLMEACSDSLQLGPRRSQRLQNSQAEWVPKKLHGGEQRSGASFMSPEPRGLRQRDRRHPSIQGQHNGSPGRRSHQSPTKGSWREGPWKQTPAARGRGRGGRGSPSLSRASMEISTPSCDESAQGIQAHYGQLYHSNESREGVHPWMQKGWIKPSGGLAQNCGAQHASSSQSSQRWWELGDAARFSRADASMSQFHSPLRAHAPPFVPQALQSIHGHKAELHSLQPQADGR